MSATCQLCKEEFSEPLEGEASRERTHAAVDRVTARLMAHFAAKHPEHSDTEP